MSMSPEVLHYDRGFRPDLVNHELIKSVQMEWITKWGMTDPGVPVAMPGNNKAAVWRGTFNQHDEAPVLAVVLHRMAKISPAQSYWYAGALAVDAIKQAPSEQMAILEAAEHGPYTLPEAVELLANFIPPALYANPT